MAHIFDITTKHLVEADPRGWAAFVGLEEADDIRLIDADLATVSAEADKVLRIEGSESYLANLELQSNYDARIPERILRYNVLLRGRHGLPVRSIVILLRPEADGLAMTGELQDELPKGNRYLWFRYDVIRLWQKSSAELLAGSLAILPLAPLAAVKEADLRGVVQRMEQRIRKETAPDLAETLWSATYILMGLLYPPEFAQQLLQGIWAMKESSTYQAILDEGRLEGEQRGLEKGRLQEALDALLLFGNNKFSSPPDKRVLAKLKGIKDIDRLHHMMSQVSKMNVSTWKELLRAGTNGASSN